MPQPVVLLTPRQVAERLGLKPSTLRKHALTFEAVVGVELPRGEHLERLWSETDVALLGEALATFRHGEAASVEEALRTSVAPVAPLPVPLPGDVEALRALIHNELRAVVREEVRAAVREELAVIARRELVAPSNEMRAAIRAELREALDSERARLHAVLPTTQAPELKRPSFLERLWALLRS